MSNQIMSSLASIQLGPFGLVECLKCKISDTHDNDGSWFNLCAPFSNYYPYLMKHIIIIKIISHTRDKIDM